MRKARTGKRIIFTASQFQTYINSLIYYVPENWEDAGYKIPKTMEELEALIARIVADGEKPWCDWSVC